MPTWARTNRKRRCPICQADHFCTIHTNGRTVHCMRVQSSRLASGVLGGWLHRVGEPITGLRVTQAPKKVKDVTGLAKRFYQDRLAADQRRFLAQQLGVSVESLEALRVGIGWDRTGECWSSFPMRGSSGEIIGITRRYEDRTKKTVAGTSNSGIFCAADWWKTEGPVLIVEGASDVAALLTYGLCALGRPSNIGGIPILREYLKRAPNRPVVVLGEHDAKPERRGKAPCTRSCVCCSLCWPGRYGAMVVSDRLKCDWRMIPEPYKDVRDWANGTVGFREVFLKWLKAREP